jgi:hypothetical protein
MRARFRSRRPVRSCIDTRPDQVAEIEDAMLHMGSFPGMADLWQRGAFHHREDVAFARIMLQRGELSVDHVFSSIKDTYRTIRCAPVLPSN